MGQEKKLADSAEKGSKKQELERKSSPTVVDKPSTKANEFTPLQMLVAEHLSKGMKLPDVARKFRHQLAPHEPHRQMRLKKARGRIRGWLKREKFRTLVWGKTMEQIDVAAPDIIGGLIQKGAAGRVDAARYLFELNGRHSPHTEDKPAEIHINFGPVARPPRQLPPADVEATEEEIEEVELD